MSAARITPEISGGCQCGKVSYVLRVVPTRSHFCHCRMCQRAVGGPFAALTGVGRGEIDWQGQPAFFRSSSVARRGFCAACGTPLSFEYPEDERVCVTKGSLDCHEDFSIEIHQGGESRWPCVALADGLPQKTIAASAEDRLAGMISYQAETGA